MNCKDHLCEGQVAFAGPYIDLWSFLKLLLTTIMCPWHLTVQLPVMLYCRFQMCRYKHIFQIQC